MRPGRGLAMAAATAAGMLAAATATAQTTAQRPAAPQKVSLDSEAPPGSPPHWLPDEPWVAQHWLPYDERRLYRLLKITRGDVWRQLRDDTRTLAELAERRGWAPEALARELVAPRRRELADDRRVRTLERRALRTLTQGHLAQHVFFHSLHQDALPDNAPEIFGTASTAEWLQLRRSELSPLQICRLKGLSGGHAQRAAEAELRATARRGVESGATPRGQADRLLRRQLRQLPRWLQQSRYNGPPPVRQPRSFPATASNYSNNAVLSHDGRNVAFESYEAGLAVAKTRGEIAVMARLPGAPAPLLASAAEAVPRSNYNPAMSGDGRWIVYESAAGNLNFAKRYGEMAIFVRDLALGRIRAISHPAGRRAPGSAYNPAISADGRAVAYEAYERPEAGGRTDIVVHDLRTGRTERVRPPAGASAATEPHLSGDGRRLVYSAIVRRRGELRSQVLLRRLGDDRSRPVSGPAEEAWAPRLSADGRTAAYTSGRSGGRSAVVVRDLHRGRRTVVDVSQHGGLAFEPSLSANGARVAYVAGATGVRRTQVVVTDLRTGTDMLVSRADGRRGAAASGTSTHPVISGDGTRVAFTSDAWNLDAGKCNGARGIFVRDLARAQTTLVSARDGANRFRGPAKGSSPGDGVFDLRLCGAGPTSSLGPVA